MRFAWLALSIGMTVVGCRQTTAPPVPLSVSIQASATIVPRGDTITFTVNAAGNNLVGVVMDYGDDVLDQYATGGALSARVTFRHAYSSTGTFAARAVVTDAIGGDKEVTIDIVVN